MSHVLTKQTIVISIKFLSVVTALLHLKFFVGQDQSILFEGAFRPL
ncbi:hypothetical protein HMPREF1210_00827 [Paenisporosarcina sp. HGH0030]|nr:hypothetical protein HMPREF1210_00827 [Paenisporosarcina sp. HGH0030]